MATSKEAAPRNNGDGDGGAVVPVEKQPLAGALTRQEAMGAIGSALSAQAVAQVSLAMQFALANPRNEDYARGQVVKFCERFTFAEKAIYAYPRADTTVTGPGVVLAKEMAKVWRNIQSGHYTVADLEDSRTVRCWAWDVEANVRQEQDVTFGKLVYRKKGGWREADERELLELTNRNGSKGVRNCILALLPWDMVQDAVGACKATVDKKIKEDPEKFRKDLVASFASIGVNGEELTEFVGYPLEQLSKKHVKELAELRGVYQRIRDNEATWQEVVAEKWGKLGGVGAAPATAKDLRQKVRDEAASLGAGKGQGDPDPPGEAAPPPQGRRPKEGG